MPANLLNYQSQRVRQRPSLRRPVLLWVAAAVIWLAAAFLFAVAVLGVLWPTTEREPVLAAFGGTLATGAAAVEVAAVVYRHTIAAAAVLLALLLFQFGCWRSLISADGDVRWPWVVVALLMAALTIPHARWLIALRLRERGRA